MDNLERNRGTRASTLATLAALAMSCLLLIGCAGPQSAGTSSASSGREGSATTSSARSSAAERFSLVAATDDGHDADRAFAAQAAEEMGVPQEAGIMCSIGEPVYWEEGDQWLRGVAFYEDGQLCAGADCDESGTPVTHFVYYL